MRHRREGDLQALITLEKEWDTHQRDTRHTWWPDLSVSYRIYEKRWYRSTKKYKETYTLPVDEQIYWGWTDA